RAEYRFEVKADWGAVAHALSESLRIRQDTHCAQRLRIAFQQDTLSRVSAKRGCDCFLPKSQLYKIQIGVDFGGLQMPSLLFFHIGTERIQHAIGNGIVRKLGRTIVINFVDTIRFETGNFPSYKLSREVESSFDDATAHRRRRQRPRFDVRSDSAAAIENSARSGAERRRA